MSQHFADRLINAIAENGAPVCVGIDPIVDLFPAQVRPANLNDHQACVDSIYSFVTAVLETVAPLVPVVKFQSAYFEKYLWEGVEAYYSLIGEARNLGLIVIGDVKRGDIGSTSEAYAHAHLLDNPFDDVEETHAPDAITINPMLGLDSIEPFVAAAREFDKGLFALVRTSNPGSKDFQDVNLQSGQTWSEHVADQLNTVACRDGLVGRHGFSSIGAVVGATQSHTMRSMRQRMPRSIFLLPGYGTQGATAEMTRAAFVDGKGAIVSASRSVLYPPAAGESWTDAVRAAAVKMRDEVASTIA